MHNFVFQNTTKLIFGKGQIAKLATELPKGVKILVTFGGGSVKKNGVYDQVVAALEGFEFVEFWGIEPNPRVETLRKAIALGKEEGVGYVLAVGGGSVSDGSKLVAAAIPTDADAWDLVIGKASTTNYLPIATVMTLPATGSEMNACGVISCNATDEKYPYYSQNPKFSILDPETTFSLPPYMVACGLTDTFIHVMEQYLTSNQSPLMDRWAEGILLTVKETAPKVMANSHDYDAMANYMLCATMALNDFVRMGVDQDWATHMIGHEITALTGITHGHTLSIVMPAMMSVLREQKWAKILQFGARVWDITTGTEEERVEATIAATEGFFRSLGLKTRLSENNVGEEVVAEIIKRFTERNVAFGEQANVTADVVKVILDVCK